MSTVTWPNAVRVSGLPFMLQGWNNIYVRIDEPGNEYPTYVLQRYSLYDCIDIAKATIGFSKLSGHWVLFGNGFNVALSKNKSDDITGLIGDWSDNVKVSNTCTIREITIPISLPSINLRLLIEVLLVLVILILYNFYV